jgi:hypothetical protein
VPSNQLLARLKSGEKLLILERYEKIKKAYGKYSSWLIYEEDCSNYKCIENRIIELNPRFVFCALNAARETDNYWQPFHIVYKGGKGWVLRDVLGKSIVFMGSYITDLIKGYPESKSNKVLAAIKEKKINLECHVKVFQEEINDLSIDGRCPIIIVLGRGAKTIFTTQLLLTRFNSVCEFVTHYSATGKFLKRFKNEIKSLEEKYSKI